MILKVSGRDVIIDDDDYDKVRSFSWCITKNGYVHGSKFRGEKRVRNYLHRLVMDACVGSEIDHKNSDKLDNRKSNLRFCNRSENSFGKKNKKRRSIYRGVTVGGTCWRAAAILSSGGKLTVIGSYKTELEAAIAYDIAAIRSFGLNAKTNILPPMPIGCKIEIKNFV